MTMLEKFMEFAKSLPADRLGEIEELLATLMQSRSTEGDLTPGELAEIDRRLAEDREIADQSEIEALLGRKLPE